jgi:heme/copper-type cytochrome/quinol oxidase subunit 3
MATTATEAQLARRIRIQLVLTAVFAVLTVLAALVPAWIELTTGLDPDHGNGDLEWLLAVGFGAVAVVFGVLAWLTRRQLAVIRSIADN